MTRKPPARVKQQVLNVEARAARADQRRRLGSLVALRVAAQTRNRYCKAYARLSAFAQEREVRITRVEDLDMLLSWYIETLWQEGDPRPYANDAAAAVQYYFPAARRNLNLAWSLCAAWGRHELPAQALPLTPSMLAGFCGAFLLAGEPRLAAMSVLAFDALARTGEFLSLERENVFLEKNGKQAVLAFHATKRGARLGVDESIVIDDDITLVCLRYLCADRLPGDKLLGLSEQRVRKRWAHVTACLGLEGFTIRPYSLRRGGATHRYRVTGNLHTVASRGRWASLSTTRRYIDDGTAALASLCLSEWQEKNLAALRQIWLQPSKN